MREERYRVVSPKPELVTLANGEVVSMSRHDDAVVLRKDTRFRRLEGFNRLKRVWAKVPDPDPEAASEPEAPEVTADSSVEMLGLRAGTTQALLDADLKTVGLLKAKIEADGLGALVEIRGVGEKSLGDIEEALSKID